MIRRVIVMKFGGAALGDAEGFRRAAEAVIGAEARRPLVVVSAVGGVTDLLLDAVRPDHERSAGVAKVTAQHRRLAAELQVEGALLDPLLGELEDVVRGVRLVGTATPKSRDHVASFGERLSARLLAAVLQGMGTAATAVDAWDLGLLTDSRYGRARPLPDDGRIARALGGLAGVVVVTGFVAKDPAGNITTLGRNGSDYSAALLAAAAAADEIQVWKDVAGVHTADPKLVPAARPIRTLGFQEACELSWFGSKVLHPGTMLPALERGIPLSVRSLRDPGAPGTTIVADEGVAETGPRAVVHRRTGVLLTVNARSRSPDQPFLAELFRILGRTEHELRPLAVSEASALLLADTVDVMADPDLRAIARVEASSDFGVVGLVGRGIGTDAGTARTMLSALVDTGVPVHCFGFGARSGSITALVPEARVDAAVRALHERLF